MPVTRLLSTRLSERQEWCDLRKMTTPQLSTSPKSHLKKDWSAEKRLPLPKQNDNHAKGMSCRRATGLSCTANGLCGKAPGLPRPCFSHCCLTREIQEDPHYPNSPSVLLLLLLHFSSLRRREKGRKVRFAWRTATHSALPVSGLAKFFRCVLPNVSYIHESSSPTEGMATLSHSWAKSTLMFWSPSSAYAREMGC